jgi:ATP-dependent exoDNAse (exonuclease V) alpha subunit
MNARQLEEIFRTEFEFEPTSDQDSLISNISEFLLSGTLNSVFVLKGYAGTGKTSVVSNLVRVLPALNAHCILLAPTGRAAKVLFGYAKWPAYTIHKKIYRAGATPDGAIAFKLMENKHVNTLFIVDEASMISDGTSSDDRSFFNSRNLLDDLIEYVYTGENCRLILIGDTAQLPPVNMSESPALNITYLKTTYNLETWTSELKEVVRQDADSGILFNATLVREKLLSGKKGYLNFTLDQFTDIKRLQGQDASDLISEAFSNRDFYNTIVVCRSNKRANLYNQFIRQRVLFREEEISAGDLLMVVKNNYHWLPKDSQASFIANGDIVEIKRIRKTEELYGFRFANITIRLVDYPEEPELDVIVMLNTLYAEGPSLNNTDSNKLYEQIQLDYDDEPNKRKRLSKIKNNPYFNALQVKFAYALTCHKAQGGQWENVFVEMGYIPGNEPDHEYYRWLYTATTRATRNLYLLGFTDKFFHNTAD